MKKVIFWCAMLVGAACNPAPKLKQTILNTSNSPDLKRELLVVRQDPGALGSYSTAVFVREIGKSEIGERVFVAKGQTKIEVRWKSKSQAIVTHDARKEDIFSQLLSSDGVVIEYQALK